MMTNKKVKLLIELPIKIKDIFDTKPSSHTCHSNDPATLISIKMLDANVNHLNTEVLSLLATEKVKSVIFNLCIESSGGILRAYNLYRFCCKEESRSEHQSKVECVHPTPCTTNNL